MGRLGWALWAVVAFVGAVVLGLLYVTAAIPIPRDLEDGESPFAPLGTAIGDAVRQVGDAMTNADMPARWGGGIRRLAPVTQPFFAALFRAMEARGWQARSNAHHNNLPGYGLRALDIVDVRWARNAWQQPIEPYVSFYRDLGELAQAVGLTWGGTFRHGKWHGCDEAWAKAWYAATGWEDMIHVEWNPSAGTEPRELENA